MLDKKKILFVDNDAILIEFLISLVTQMGFTGLKATNGIQGLQVAIEEKPAIIITDHVMKEMSGIDFCKAIRNNTQLQDAIILVFTGSIVTEEEVESFHDIADSWISKLEGFEGLKKIIRAWATMVE